VKKTQTVTIGGGSGQFVLLSGLRVSGRFAITSVVSMVDSGGSTGRLRDELGIIGRAEETDGLARVLDDNEGVYLVPAFAALAVVSGLAAAPGSRVSLPGRGRPCLRHAACRRD